MKQVIFTLTSARSGTVFLRHLFRHNARDCVTRHETFFDWGNPTMLGPAVYDAYAGRLDRLRALLAKKRAYIERLPGSVYLESSHAFLKSAYLVALQLFPEMQLIHLIRDPLKVAKSEAYREAWRRRVHAPFHYYRGDDGRRHFYWSLTGNEEIYRAFDLSRLSLFQRNLLQWIEIENRAMAFLDANHLHDRCFTIQAPRGLNDARTIKAMFDFFGLATNQPQLLLAGRRNKSFARTTVITPEDDKQARDVLVRLPAQYLRIFHYAPYATEPWCSRLLPQGSAEKVSVPAAARTSG